jgi:sugar O-acyltransferase (sialic acid O-acetyltransferase NeuD family)
MNLRVVILGAGGHAQVVADILFRMQEADQAVIPIGYLDDNTELQDKYRKDLDVLGVIADLPKIPHDAVVIGVGDNATRQRLFESLCNQGEHFATARHPQAVVAPDVEIGDGTVICAGVILNPGSLVGQNVILNTSSTVDHHNRIGNHAHIAPGVHLGGDVSVGIGTLIGMGAIVTPQRTIGMWSVIGAGSVVIQDVGDFSVAVGVPARMLKENKHRPY